MNSSIKRIRSATAAAVLVIMAAGTPARATEIVVNGEAVTPLDQIVLTVWNCGNQIPEGRYWLDYASGAMGLENGPAAGVLPCYPLAAQSQPSVAAPSPEAEGADDSQSPYWEDRMCAMGMCDGVVINPVY
jgi:hypothetical protein